MNHQDVLRMAALLVLLAACSNDRVAGGSSIETENTSSRMLRIDSILPTRNPDTAGATVSTLDFNALDFDFPSADSSGRSLSIERLDGSLVPFQTVFWDRRAALGRLKVRIDPVLRSSHSYLVLRWNQPLTARSDSAGVWQGFTPDQILLLNSVFVDDFEDGALRNQLPDSADWTDSATVNAKFSNFDVRAATGGLTGNVLHFTYSADSVSGQYALVKTQLATTPRCLRSMDSLVLWVRCSGVFTLALENHSGPSTTKAWVNWKLDSTQWNRLRVRPQDFLPADGKYGNVGWSGVRDSVTHLTLFMTGTGEFSLDDVRIHGIDRDDLR